MNIQAMILTGSIIAIGTTLYGAPTTEISNETEKEDLQIVTLNYRNGENDREGILLDLYEYSVSDNKMKEIIELPVDPGYPVAYYDHKREKVFFSDDPYGYNYDNLYEYDFETDKIKQVTFGKNIFNDMFVVSDKMYLNVAPQYSTVMKPAIFDMDTYEITYLDAADNDTWYTSLSYNSLTDKLLTITNSDDEMRTNRVRSVTHIRPKSIISFSPEFKDFEELYHTEDYEIYLSRQFDENHILMTYDQSMMSLEPRKLKILDIKSKEVSDYDIPGIHEVYSFYPRNNGEGIYILGSNNEGDFDLYYYDIQNHSTQTVFQPGELPDSHRSIVDFIYYVE